MLPVSLLLLSRNVCRLLRFPNEVGIVPVSPLLLSCNVPRPVAFHVGMPPVKALSLRSTDVKLVRLLNSVGIVPVSWLWSMRIDRSSVRSPSAAGRLPFKLCSFSFSPVRAYPGTHKYRSLARLPSAVGRLPFNVPV